jgi:hypothetical protein
VEKRSAKTLRKQELPAQLVWTAKSQEPQPPAALAGAVVDNNLVGFFRRRYFMVNIFDKNLNVAVEEKGVSDKW